MKVIDIQNCTDFKDKMFKLIVNGEEHVMHTQFLNVRVADNKPFEVKVKYGKAGSPAYTFDPKDSMLLQIQTDKKTTGNSLKWLFASFLLTLVAGYFWGNGHFAAFIPSMIVFIPMIYQTVKRKKFFVIQEVA